MKDRFVSYGIILMSIYIIFYIWSQYSLINKLEDALYEQDEVIMDLREAILYQGRLIELQGEYIEESVRLRSRTLWHGADDSEPQP